MQQNVQSHNVHIHNIWQHKAQISTIKQSSICSKPDATVSCIAIATVSLQSKCFLQLHIPTGDIT